MSTTNIALTIPAANINEMGLTTILDKETSHVFCVEPDHIDGGRWAFVQIVGTKYRYIVTAHSSGTVWAKKVGSRRDLKPDGQVGQRVIGQAAELLAAA